MRLVELKSIWWIGRCIFSLRFQLEIFDLVTGNGGDYKCLLNYPLEIDVIVSDSGVGMYSMMSVKESG